jgi:hypothetical protein
MIYQQPSPPPSSFPRPRLLRKLTYSIPIFPDNWVTVPTNSTLTIHKQTVLIHPIIDEYYNPSPAHLRSSGFADSQGLAVDGVGAAGKVMVDGVGARS